MDKQTKEAKAFIEAVVNSKFKVGSIVTLNGYEHPKLVIEEIKDGGIDTLSNEIIILLHVTYFDKNNELVTYQSDSRLYKIN